MGASFGSMPQENYKLIDFDWDRTLEKLRNSRLILGDFANEGIGYTKGVVCAHVKVKSDKVSFNLSFYGKIQLSHPNNELLSRAKSNLRNLIVCDRWIPKDEIIEKSISNELLMKRLDTIRLANLSDPVYAYVDLRFFIETLPSYIRNLVESEIQQVDSILIILSKNPSWQQIKQERKKGVYEICCSNYY